jgi:hypothetical protein
MLTDRGALQEAAINLIELSSEVDELEAGRVSLLKRVEVARDRLLAAGDRAVSIRASADLLREHIRNSAANAADLRAIKEEVNDFGRSITEVTSESLGLLFEADGIQDSLGEAEEEMDRLLAILVEGKARDPRGH